MPSTEKLPAGRVASRQLVTCLIGEAHPCVSGSANAWVTPLLPCHFYRRVLAIANDGQTGFNLEGATRLRDLRRVGFGGRTLVDKLSWHAQLYRQAYTDFSVPASRADRLAYCTAIAGQIVYRACLAIFWGTLNICTLPFGVFVEPLWRKFARFRLLQFPRRIPVIAVALPLLLAYAAYQTFQIYGVWHVILPFVAIAAASTTSLGLFGGFNLLRRKFP